LNLAGVDHTGSSATTQRGRGDTSVSTASVDIGLLAQRRRGLLLAITGRRIRRGAFDSVDHLQNAITRYIDSHNNDCRPFVWTASVKAIMRGCGWQIG
jgi:hypothetical protein